MILHDCGWYSLAIAGFLLSRHKIVVHRNPEKSGLYISRVFSYLTSWPLVLCSCLISRSEITSLLISEARPDSSCAITVEDKCRPVLSAEKNMYLGFL